MSSNLLTASPILSTSSNMTMASPTLSSEDTDFMVGPFQERRIIIQCALLVLLLMFGTITNGSIGVMFVRFKNMRSFVKLGLVLDLATVELLDVLVNIPLFMDYYLFTKKRNLTRQTRWYAMFFHRFFLLNDLASQLGLTIDCFLDVQFGKRYTSKKTSARVLTFIALKWAVLFILLLGFSIPLYTQDSEDYVSDEAYQRVLFGPNQIIWKVVIPTTLCLTAVSISLTAAEIRRARYHVKEKYGMRVFGRGSKDSSKALTTLAVTMITQATLRIPAISYSYIAVEGDIEGDRWFAFFGYFCLFFSSTLMPVIFYCRTLRFRRALLQLIKHPCTSTSYLDHVASLGINRHRNGREIKSKRSKKIMEVPQVEANLQGAWVVATSTTTSKENTIDTGISLGGFDSILGSVERLDADDAQGYQSVQLVVGEDILIHSTKVQDSDTITTEGEFTYDTWL